MLKRIATASIVLTLVVSGAAFAAALTGTKVTLHPTNKGRCSRRARAGRSTSTRPTARTRATAPARAPRPPPLMTKAKPVAGPGVKQALLGTTKRPNGKLQVTYNGHPLYRYVGGTSRPHRRRAGEPTAFGTSSAPPARRSSRGCTKETGAPGSLLNRDAGDR